MFVVNIIIDGRIVLGGAATVRTLSTSNQYNYHADVLLGMFVFVSQLERGRT